MKKYHNYEGLRHNCFVVVKKDYKIENGRHYYLCKCDCGNDFLAQASEIKRRYSCGCRRNERAIIAHTKHGHVYEKLNHIWRGMKQRCKNPNSNIYKYYGGKGVKVCKEWDESYAVFREWAYANGYFDTADRSACTLDRIDKDGDYCPENCRWVDMKEQSNNRSTNHPITYKGETHNLTEWSRIIGMQEPTLSARLQSGWSIEEAFETPLGTMKKIKKLRCPYVYNGKEYSLPQLAKEYGIDHKTLYWRIKHGWDLDKALNTKKKKYCVKEKQ